jgi:tryptophanyl-tRNA synthetase
VYAFHKTFSSVEEVEMVNMECRQAGIGCVDCKRRMARNLNASLEPFRAARAEFDQNPEAVWDVLHEGGQRARLIARETICEVKAAIGLP